MFWVFAFPVVIYLRWFHYRRLYRGVITRFLHRNFGLAGPLYVHCFQFLLLLAAIMSSFVGPRGVTDAELALYWTISFVWAVVDYITGGDDPGRRLRKLARALKKKLTLAPAPRPVINLR
jgi:hypothetical protein